MSFQSGTGMTKCARLETEIRSRMIKKESMFYRLELAKQAHDLGARSCVIEALTGIKARNLAKWLSMKGEIGVTGGKIPNSSDWVFERTNYVSRVHCTHFYAYYRTFQRGGAQPVVALIKAYQLYKARYGYDCRISFDRAFCIIDSVHCQWLTKAPTLAVSRCLDCGASILNTSSYDTAPIHGCLLCQFEQRWKKDERVQFALTNPTLNHFYRLIEANCGMEEEVLEPDATLPASARPKALFHVQ